MIARVVANWLAPLALLVFGLAAAVALWRAAQPHPIAPHVGAITLRPGAVILPPAATANRTNSILLDDADELATPGQFAQDQAAKRTVAKEGR